jgi:hypothetical protein
VPRAAKKLQTVEISAGLFSDPRFCDLQIETQAVFFRVLALADERGCFDPAAPWASHMLRSLTRCRTQDAGGYVPQWWLDGQFRALVASGLLGEEGGVYRLAPPASGPCGWTIRSYGHGKKLLSGSALGYVYFVQGASGSPIKIGWAREPQKRIATLQTGRPEPLRALALIEGSRRLEGSIQKHYARLRIRGEWFEPRPSLLKFIEKVNSGEWPPKPALATGTE